MSSGTIVDLQCESLQRKRDVHEGASALASVLKGPHVKRCDVGDIRDETRYLVKRRC